MRTKYINNSTVVNLDRASCAWDNGIRGDHRIELWSDDAGNVWIETNGDPVTDREDLILLLVEQGVDRNNAEAAADGDMSWIE